MSAAMEAVINARRRVRTAACKVELAELGLTDVDSSVAALGQAETELDAASGVLAEAVADLKAEQAAAAGRIL